MIWTACIAHGRGHGDIPEPRSRRFQCHRFSQMMRKNYVFDGCHSSGMFFLSSTFEDTHLTTLSFMLPSLQVQRKLKITRMYHQPQEARIQKLSCKKLEPKVQHCWNEFGRFNRSFSNPLFQTTEFPHNMLWIRPKPRWQLFLSC